MSEPQSPTPGSLVSHEEFDQIFEAVKNWGRWGPDDQLGTLNYITPERISTAAGLIRVKVVITSAPDAWTILPGSIMRTPTRPSLGAVIDV